MEYTAFQSATFLFSEQILLILLNDAENMPLNVRLVSIKIMMTRVSLLFFCTLFCASTAIACTSSIRSLKGKNCEVTHNQTESDVSWSGFVTKSREKCGLSDQEVAWLQENAPAGSHILEQTDEEYKTYAESLEMTKEQKTALNVWKWSTIDKMNECGATTIYKRKGSWTISIKDRGTWHDGGCLRPKC